MKKFLKLCTIFALIAMALFMVTGCPTEEDENNSEQPVPMPGREPDRNQEPLSGVVGLFSGVVYDSVTFMPLSGVEVKLVGSGATRETGNDGSFWFENVGVGSQDLIFSKDNYQFYRVTVNVDPQEYVNKDPFLEVSALNSQLEALIASAGGSFTLDDTGVGTSGDESVSIKVTKKENGYYEIRQYKLDYTYEYFQPVPAIAMVPLTGELSAKIKIAKNFIDNSSATATPTLSTDFIDIPNGVNVWLTDTGSLNTGASVYGPFVTESGGFTAAWLPANKQLTLRIDRFEQGGLVYNVIPYTWGGSTGFTTATLPVTGFNKPVNAGTLYLFATRGYATITSYTAGTPDAPLTRNDSVTVTFSEAMDPTTVAFTFAASTNTAPGNNLSTATLIPSWNAAGTTVTLTLPDGVKLPYSASGLLRLTTLTLTNGANFRAKSGAQLYNTTVNIPVYTEEVVKLVNVDVTGAGAPQRLAIGATAIKLEFSKVLAPNSVFTWSFGSPAGGTTTTNRPATWKFGSTNDIVFVYTDILPTSGANNLLYRAVSAADPSFDINGTLDGNNINVTASGTPTVATVLNIGTAGLQKEGVEQLTLKSTSLWTPTWQTTGVRAIAADNANYVVGTITGGTSPAITITFDKNIPTGSKIEAFLYDTQLVPNQTVPVTVTPEYVTGTANNFTIKPDVRLVAGRVYDLYFTVQDVLSSNTANYIFDANRLQQYSGRVVNTNGTGANTRIRFQTQADPAVTQNTAIERVYGFSTNKASVENITSAGFNVTGTGLVIGKEYYIVFPEPIIGTLAASYTTTSDNGTSVQDGITIKVTRYGEKVLGFIVEANAAGQADIEGPMENNAGLTVQLWTDTDGTAASYYGIKDLNTSGTNLRISAQVRIDRN